MNYASECQPNERNMREMVRTIISTSFYDKRVCVWNLRLAESEHGILTVSDNESFKDDIN